MFKIELTKDDIYELIEEYDLWKFYIPSFKKLQKPFCSELRKDLSPSCSIFVSGKRLLYKDFGTGECLDIFEYIKKKYNCTFQECLNIINNDFKLNNSLKNKVTIPEEYKKEQIKKVIKVKIRNWGAKDKIYWEGKYFVKQNILIKYNVFPIEFYTIYKNDERFDFRPKTITYGYWFGNDDWKIYSPYEKEYKHIQNTSQIFGIKQLPNNSDKLIITSSPKDALVWKSLGYWSISPPSESYNFQDEIMENLKSRFKKIYLNYDNDAPGLNYTNNLTKVYNFLIPLFVPEQKDISDYIDYKKDKNIVKNEISKKLV